MTQAPEIARPAAGAPAGMPGAAAGGPPDFNKMAEMYLNGHTTGLEGREEEFSRAVINVIKTLSDRFPYAHEVNDALVKAWLTSIQFAKDEGILDRFVQKDIDIMRPVNQRLGQLIQMTSKPEIALEAVAGWSPCHYHLVVTDTLKEPGRRTFLSPFKLVLDAGRRINQFDFDERFVHEQWFIPRMHGFAKDLGVKFEVAPWNEETRLVTVALA